MYVIYATVAAGHLLLRACSLTKRKQAPLTGSIQLTADAAKTRKQNIPPYHPQME
jgi:hypothetical protein